MPGTGPASSSRPRKPTPAESSPPTPTRYRGYTTLTFRPYALHTARCTLHCASVPHTLSVSLTCGLSQSLYFYTRPSIPLFNTISYPFSIVSGRVRCVIS